MLIFQRIRKLELLLPQNLRNVRSFITILPLSSYKSLENIKKFSSISEKPVVGKNEKENQSFTYSYLVNSRGFSPEIAKTVSKRVNFETPERPDSVLNFLTNQGFPEAHVSRMVQRLPALLLAVPDNLLPKFQFLRSKGASSLDLAIIFSNNSNLCHRSLDKHIIPCYNALKVILFDDEKVIKTLKRASSFCTHQVEKHVVLNISFLKQIGMSQSSIAYLVSGYPSVVCPRDDKFADNVKKVMEMGFDPSKYSFVLALVVNSGMSEKP